VSGEYQPDPASANDEPTDPPDPAQPNMIAPASFWSRWRHDPEPDVRANMEGELFDYSVDGDTITVSIVGPVNATENAPPESAEVRALADDLANELDEPVELIVRVFPYNQFSSNATPDGSGDAQD
jgi:hypothetical protein